MGGVESRICSDRQLQHHRRQGPVASLPSAVVSPVVSSFGGDDSVTDSDETDEFLRAAREFASLGPPPVAAIGEWARGVPPPNTLQPVAEPDILSDCERDWRELMLIDATPDTYDIEEERARRAAGTTFVSALMLDSPRETPPPRMQKHNAAICC